MTCKLCSRKLGIFRALTGARFCCAEHARLAKVCSARLVRDFDRGPYEGQWPSFTAPENEDRRNRKVGPLSTLLVAASVLLLAVAALSSPGGGSSAASPVQAAGGTLPQSRASIASVPAGSGLLSGFRSFLPSWDVIAVRDDFRNGLENWVGASASDWTRAQNTVRPGKLRLLKQSLSLEDYQMDFEAQIERRSLGWVFRASDLQNYYATKLQVNKSGILSPVSLVRYAVVNGKESTRSYYPVPVMVQKDTVYKVLVAVKGTSFVTTLNGQVIDSWSDSRLKAGGVGFFAEKGDIAALRYVSLSKKHNLLDGLFATTLFLPPAFDDSLE